MKTHLFRTQRLGMNLLSFMALKRLVTKADARKTYLLRQTRVGNAPTQAIAIPDWFRVDYTGLAKETGPIHRFICDKNVT